MNKIRIKMKRQKETKNTFRYEEIETKGQPPVLNTLYIQKWVNPPNEIVVTIEGGE